MAVRALDKRVTAVPGPMVGDFYSNTYTFLVEGLNYGACITLGRWLGTELAKA